MKRNQLFTMDGVNYNVHVTNLTRHFSVLDTEKSGRTMDGQMHREPIGTFYNYSMTVSPDAADPAAMDAFWEAISKPVDSHVCVFPYGQSTLTQKMYVTGGDQPLQVIAGNTHFWGEITVKFIAMGPKVVA